MHPVYLSEALNERELYWKQCGNPVMNSQLHCFSEFFHYRSVVLYAVEF